MIKIIVFIIIISLLIAALNIEHFSEFVFIKSNNKLTDEIKKHSKHNIVIVDDNKDLYTVASIITNNSITDLDNKINFTNFIKGKYYYPETYIYDRDHSELPTDNQLWFIKNTSVNSYGGKGIQVANYYKKIKDLLNPNYDYIIQRNVDNLLLFNGIKGDVRMYYLIVSDENKYSFYLYKDGIVRLAKTKYNLYDLSLSNQLTNVTQSSKFDKNNFKLSTHDYYVPFMKRIKEVLIDLSKEIKNRLLNDHKNNQILEYQLCGADFIFNKNFDPYLLEINSKSPAYLMRKNTIDVLYMKKHIASKITDNLIKPILKNKKINFEKNNFIKLI